jgi:DNA-binding NarL/FixJ family response regulator
MAPESTTSAKTRVFLIDDHPGMRRGITACIAEEPDLVVCGQAGNAAEAMQGIARTKPDVILTDISLPGRDGLDLIKEVRAREPHALVLVLSMHDESLYAERALRAGARGYVMKSAPTDELMDAIRRVRAGEVAIGRRVVGAIAAKVAGNPRVASLSLVDCLSDRELEVFRLLGQGMPRRDIAEQLGLSVKTVETHRANIREKLGVRSAAALRQQAGEFLRDEAVGP